MTSNAADPNIGQVIDDRYRIVRRVARGGMATVYEALDRRLDRSVAVKIMHPHLAESADFVARFQREARAAAKLSHKNAVAVHDQGTWRDAGYLVMEYVRGPNLRQELRRRGSFPLGEALFILDEVLDALACAHRAGLVHRDIKPENVILEAGAGEPTAKVTDFGLARAVTEATAASTGTVLGTVAYLAPEIITHGTADPRADVYAAGILLYELIVGAPPLAGESPIQVAYQHVHGEIPTPSQAVDWLPQEIDELVAALTAREPVERPQDADAARSLVLRCREALDEETLERRADIPGDDTIPDPFAAVALIVAQEAVNASEAETTMLSTNRTAVLDIAEALGVSSPPPPPPGADENAPPQMGDPTPVAARVTPPGPLGPDYGAEGSELAVAGNGTALATLADGSPETAEQKRSRKRRRALVTLVSLLGVVAAAVGFWFLLGPGSMRTIPDVSGLTIEQAGDAIRAADLTPTIGEENHDDVPEGEVIGTDPPGGDEARRGSKVTIRVSLGVLMLTMPEVKSMEDAEAEALVYEAGFEDITVEDIYSDDVPLGFVVGTTPGANEVVDHRTAVIIQVSQGPAPVEVPNLAGVPEDQARASLQEHAITLSVTGTENNDHIPRGAIIRQTPNAGETVSRGSTIEVVVSEGPVMVEVPGVVGKQRGDARRILEEAGFKVVENEVLGAFFGTVRAQEPAAGTSAPRGTTVTLTIV